MRRPQRAASAPAIGAMASWAMALRPEDIPERVRRAALAQLRSVLSSLYSGAASPQVQACRRAALALGTQGRASVLPSGETAGPFAAVLANAAASMAFDFDDYLFLGHLGHSAVLVPLAVGESLDASLADLVVAQVVGNEVGGRLGAYVALGPQNGQLWAHIHLAASALAAARLRRLDAERAADALAIALYQPPFTLFPAFMGSDAKLLTAAVPAAVGLYATELAASGLKGFRGLLEHPNGLGRHFAFLPLPALLEGLGRSWVLDTLSCKVYPGCAYIDGPVDAALELLRAGPIAAEDIAGIDIEGTALTSGMEALSSEAAALDSLHPIAINFSARRSVAIALLAGRLTPREIHGTWVKDHGAAIQALVARSQVREDWQRTLSFLEGLGRALPFGRLVGTVGLGPLLAAARRLRRAYPRPEHRRGPAHRSSLRASGQSLARIGAFLKQAGLDRRPFDMGEVDFSRLEFRLGGRVTVRLRGGGERSAACEIPRGAAGSGLDRITALMREKLAQEARAHGASACADAVEELLSRPLADVGARALAEATRMPLPRGLSGRAALE